MDDSRRSSYGRHLSPEQSSAIRNRPATPLDFERTTTRSARFSRFPSDSTAEPIDFEMALDIEEQVSSGPPLDIRKPNNLTPLPEKALMSIRTKKETERSEEDHAVEQDDEHSTEERNAENPSERGEPRPDFDPPFELLPTGMNSIDNKDDNVNGYDNAVDEEESIRKEPDRSAAGDTPQSDEAPQTPEEYSPDNKNNSVLSGIHFAPPTLGGRSSDARRPFLAPFAWTVPSRNGRQESRPFLIYQDPEGYEPAEANINPYWHIAVSDDKENVPPGSRMTASEIEMDDSLVEDNIVADAESIVHFAERHGVDELSSWNISRGNLFNSAWQGRPANSVLLDDDQEYGMELSVSLGSTPTASPARSQRRHSNSIHLVGSPPRRSVIDNMEVLNGRSWGTGGLFRRRAGSSSSRL